MAHLAGITIYPIKSLAPVAVASARIAPGGGLEHDREFAIFDQDGKYVNGKRNIKVHALKASIDRKDAAITLGVSGSAEIACFDLHRETESLESWLSAYFGEPVTWRRNIEGGFPDDSKSPGPTLIGVETICEIQHWFADDGIDAAELRRRFRANLDIGGEPAFWEDRLYAAAGEVVRFRIGDVEFHGVNPCKRCIVPTRDTASGEQTPDFANRFMDRRKRQLPSWAEKSRFDHYYRLAVNTRVPKTEEGKLLRIGDPVEIVETIAQ